MATLRYHTEVVDGGNKLLPWYSPNANAWDRYLYQLWQWLPQAPTYAGQPMYYLSCGFNPGTPITYNEWENDWGEKVPNLFEFARLWYAYNGDTAPITIVKGMLDYTLTHGITPANYSWPNMCYGTADSGDASFDGHNVAWQTNALLVDLAADMGMTFYHAYQFYGTASYRTVALNTADTLASKIVAGSSSASPWPYVVNASSGANLSVYCSNWAGALILFDLLIEAGEPNAAAYTTARSTLKTWMLAYPMQNGNWVSGHSDNPINGTTNLCNTTKSNMALYLLDNPTFDPNLATHLPELLQWTEDEMVAQNDYLDTYNSAPIGQHLGAHVPCEQTGFMARLGYQTARLGAEYARWYLTSGNATHKDIAYRNLNYNTYMMTTAGQAADGPDVESGYWWGDCYGEAARMYFHGFAGLPEYAPPAENHILYSSNVLKNVSLAFGNIQYSPANASGIEYLRTTFQPTSVRVGGNAIALRGDVNAEGYVVSSLGGGDYAVTVRRAQTGVVVLSVSSAPVGTPVLSVR
jgi:hypothetical protein